MLNFNKIFELLTQKIRFFVLSYADTKIIRFKPHKFIQEPDYKMVILKSGHIAVGLYLVFQTIQCKIEENLFVL